MTLGVLLCAALVGSLLGQMLRLPRVVAYLLVGLLLGPQMLNAVTKTNLVTLDVVGKFAMALVLFNMGCHFTVPHFRRLVPRIFQLSACELGFTFLLVCLGLIVLGQSWQAGILFGALAMATAPATTMLVLKEYESEGPVTEYATALVALNNLAAVVVFEILFRVVCHTNGNTTGSLYVAFGQLVSGLAGSTVLGIAAGMLVSYCCGLLSARYWLVLLVAITSLVLGLTELLDLSYLLTFLAMGITVANASERAKEMELELDRLTGLLCVVFFVIHGAELDFHAVFAADDTGLITVAVAYIVLRATGKYLGLFLAAKMQGNTPQVRRWLGGTMLSQAGAALALVTIAANPAAGLGDLGKQLQVVIVGTVVVFEFVGPILIRHAVLKCGEVPLYRAIHHSTTTPLQEARVVVSRLLGSFGFDPRRRRSPETLTVEQIMFRNVKAVTSSSTFNDVVEFIEASSDNTYPVVDDEHSFIGVVRYADLREAMFDPELGKLVNAFDLASPSKQLHVDDSAVHAWEQFREGHDDCIPVVTHDVPPRLLGLVKRRDLMGMFARQSAS